MWTWIECASQCVRRKHSEEYDSTIDKVFKLE